MKFRAFPLLAAALLSRSVCAFEAMDYIEVFGRVELRGPGRDSRTSLNHEGGLKARVLEAGVLSHDGSRWHRVVLVNGIWDEDGNWIEPLSEFWIRISDGDAALIE